VTTAHVDRTKQQIAEQITGHVDTTVYNDPAVLASSLIRGRAYCGEMRGVSAPGGRTSFYQVFSTALHLMDGAKRTARYTNCCGRVTRGNPAPRRMAKHWCRGVSWTQYRRTRSSSHQCRHLRAYLCQYPRSLISASVSVAGVAGSWRHFHRAIASVQEPVATGDDLDQMLRLRIEQAHRVDRFAVSADFRGTCRNACARVQSAGTLIKSVVMSAEDGHVLGIVTVDDVIDAIIADGTEDVQRFGGLEALDQPSLRSTCHDDKETRWLALRTQSVGSICRICWRQARCRTTRPSSKGRSCSL
jgi:hypothetical protein